MKLLKEVTKKQEAELSSAPVMPEDGWSVGHLGNHGIMLSADGFMLKLDIDELNKMFDIIENGGSGDVKDHSGKVVNIDVGDDIVLTRANDEAYPNGIVVDEKALKELGVERDQPDEEELEGEDEPEGDEEETEDDDTIESNQLKEGIKKAFRKSGKKIKRGWRVTSGIRKGRVVANIKTAFKPRAKASTRMKLKLASKKKKIIRVLKSKRTKKRPLSKRLSRMNKR